MESLADKELRKWNTPRSQGGMRPDYFQQFPKMVYRARQRPGGGPYIVIDPANEAWSMGNCDTVHNEEQYDRHKRDGWCDTPAEAIEAAERAADSIAFAAAHRHYEDRRLSPAALAEAKAADDAVFEHVPEVQEKRRRGRPPKVKLADTPDA